MSFVPSPLIVSNHLARASGLVLGILAPTGDLPLFFHTLSRTLMRLALALSSNRCQIYRREFRAGMRASPSIATRHRSLH